MDPKTLQTLSNYYNPTEQWWSELRQLAAWTVNDELPRNGHAVTLTLKPFSDIQIYLALSSERGEGIADALLRYYDQMTNDTERLALQEAFNEAYLDLTAARSTAPLTTASGSTEGNILLDAPPDHEGHAQCVMHKYGERIAYVDAYGWMWYTGTHWTTEAAEATINTRVVATLMERRLAAVRDARETIIRRASASAPNVRGTAFMVQNKTTLPVSVFDQHPDHLNVANGVLDLRTGDLHSHDPKWYFTYCLPVEYDTSADPTEWLNYLTSVTGPEFVSFLQVALGYSLTGQTREEKMFYIYGPTRSGKGTFTETIMHMLGRDPLCAETGFETFTSDRSGDTQNFDLAPLKPCRIVFASESDKYDALKASLVKRLTGGNDIRCAFKHRDHFQYRPQFKIWLSSNEPVHADPDDDAAWARVMVIPFPHSFLGNEDTTLKTRLKMPENQRAILAWAVEGAQRWYQRGLPHPPAVEEETARHRAEQDYVQQWIDEHCEQTPAGFLSYSVSYDSYTDFMRDSVGLQPKSKRYFALALEKKGFPRDRRWYNGAATRGNVGLKLRAANA